MNTETTAGAGSVDQRVRPLVERLRGNKGGFIGGLYDLEAADEIERLSNALQHLVHNVKATGNQTIASTMTKLCHSDLIETDNSCGYPWTMVKLTDAGRRYLQDEQPQQEPRHG